MNPTRINFNDRRNISDITASSAPLIRLNETNAFEFTEPTSVYKYQLAFRDVDIKNWGIEYDGLTFKVTKFYDKQTVPAIPVKLYYYDLVNGKCTLTYYVRLEKNLADLVTLDAKDHTINAVKTKDNFVQSLDKMFTALGDEAVTWRDEINSAYITIWQVAGNADGSDKNITYQLDDIATSILDSDNNVLYTQKGYSGTYYSNLKKASKVKVDLSHGWPVDEDGNAIFSFNKEYYVHIAFEYYDREYVDYDYGTPVWGTLNTVRLPFTVGIPALSEFLVKQPGIFNGTNDGVAYIFGKDYNVAGNSVVAMQYDLTYGFVKLAEKLQPSADATRTEVKFKTNGCIDGDIYHADGSIAGIENADITNKLNANPANAQVDAAKSILMAKKDKNGKVYGQKFLIEVMGAKYVGKYAYSNDEMKAENFTITMMSPIKEGSISAADGSTTISVDATDQQKIKESKFLAKTYSTAGTKYQLFPSDETKAGSSIYSWIEYNNNGTITIEPKDDKVLKVKEIKNTVEGDNGYEGYVQVEPVNPAFDTTGDITVTVNDVWGFSISQDITINIKR